MRNIQIGVVADDITGAGDIAVMYAKAGLTVNIFSLDKLSQLPRYSSDVAVVDTDSRFALPQEAADRVRRATKALQEQGAVRFYKKTCSVFRGNIGAEFDAMLDTLGVSFAPVVLGFPDNGRTTLEGLHYVRGTLLEHSEFKNDPMNPMTCSSLPEILAGQTNRRVASLSARLYENTDTLRQSVAAAAEKGGYLIFDVRDNNDLDRIAAVTHAYPAACGASAIAASLGGYFTGNAEKRREPAPRKEKLGVFCISGSLMPQTGAQIAYALEHGVEGIALELEAMLKDARQLERRLTAEIEARIERGEDVLLYSNPSPQAVEKSRAAQQRRGLSGEAVGQCISSVLGRICRAVLERTGQNRVLVAGGDTSAAFCRELQVDGMAVYQELESGLPSCITLSPKPLLLVLKSGSFGSPAFFIKAIEHLKNA